MKKLFLAAGAALALLASCNKETEMINPAPEARPDGASVTITLSAGDDTQTRAFFDATATAEAWEKTLGTRLEIGDLLASEVGGRNRMLVLCRCELRRFVGQNPVGTHGPRGGVGRRL